MRANGQVAGVVIGLAVALCGAAGLLTGTIPRFFSGLIVIVAIGIIVGTRRAFRPSAGD
ncbi:MAG TPA: hypothetical protein VMS96_06655 [Terriglobales bacterium]|nr:hypothetical protein [Terriglobales bacterium]